MFIISLSWCSSEKIFVRNNVDQGCLEAKYLRNTCLLLYHGWSQSDLEYDLSWVCLRSATPRHVSTEEQVRDLILIRVGLTSIFLGK